VLQTALGLLEKGKEIYLLADCVSSRQPSNVHLAIERLRAEGVRIVSREMVAFEWLQRAGTDRFREISRNFLK
jgi:nicotinamidase-related amidase